MEWPEPPSLPDAVPSALEGHWQSLPDTVQSAPEGPAGIHDRDG
ncbi:hypothetical protein [Mycobacterium hubeiense]|nr:hypothetical protein [Mycobacterium sp. QGD 101]